MIKTRLKLIPYTLIIISAFFITCCLYLLKPILIPLVLSLFLFFLVSPIMEYTSRRLRFPHILSFIVAFIGILIFISIVVFIIVMSIRNIISSSAEYYRELLTLVDSMTIFLTQRGLDIDGALIRETVQNLPFLSWVQSITSQTVTMTKNLLLILLITSFLLASKKPRKGKIMIAHEVQKKITRYVLTKLLTSSMTAFLVAVVLLVFDVDLAVLFIAATFFLNFIPNVGSAIAVILPLPIVFVQYGYGVEFAAIFVLTGIIQFVVGNILDPKIMGENIGLHPVVILISLLFWGFIWGVTGAFLSVPMTAIVKLLFERSQTLAPMARFLEGDFSRFKTVL